MRRLWPQLQDVILLLHTKTSTGTSDQSIIRQSYLVSVLADVEVLNTEVKAAPDWNAGVDGRR